MTFRKVALMGVAFVGLTAVGILLYQRASISPECAIEQFLHSTDLAEDQLMDPLLLCGKDVVPLVMNRAKERTMPKRRYALMFLGNMGSRDALPLLHGIIKDPDSFDTHRGDALTALAMIDHGEAVSLSKLYHERQDHLGAVAKQLMARGKESIPRRSYWDAFWGLHR